MTTPTVEPREVDVAPATGGSGPTGPTTEPLLSVRGLTVTFVGSGRAVPAVRGIDFDVHADEVLGIVGESGSGKSVTSLAISGLLDDTAQVQGSIRLGGVEVTTLDAERLRQMRGRDVGMVFQDPTTTLNPVLPIGRQVIEGQVAHGQVARGQAHARAVELLREVDIPDPQGRVDQFPHQFSGGMRQRAVIAMAMAGRPRLIIADEPTTALDVTVQARILDLMKELQAETGMAIMLISHDLGVIAETCDNVAVMYWGKVIETAAADELFANMAHPYTRGLLASIPVTDREVERLEAIPSRVPTMGEKLSGCAFHPRCSRARPICSDIDPAAIAVAPDHFARCHFPGEDPA